MAKLIYSAIASLDGYVADADGGFEWAHPDEDVHSAINDDERSIGTYLYGRRLYEVMSFWETAPSDDGPLPIRDYGNIWRSADKVVFSASLPAVSTRRTTLERTFDPVAVAALKKSADRDLGIGGPQLAAAALRAGLVDECQVWIVPAVVGGGNNWLPDGLKCSLQLTDLRRFGCGVVALRYRIAA